MSVFLCVLLITVIFCSVQLKFCVTGKIDAYKNSGSFGIALFGLPLFGFFVCMGCGKNGESSLLISIGPKTKEIHLNKKKDDKDSIVSQKIPPLFSNLLLENLYVDINIGTENSFATAMILQSIKTLFYSLFALLRRHNISIKSRFVPEYNAEMLRVYIRGILSISLADIIYSLIRAAVKRIKEALI